MQPISYGVMLADLALTPKPQRLDNVLLLCNNKPPRYHETFLSMSCQQMLHDFFQTNSKRMPSEGYTISLQQLPDT
jgi:hypothetical protein